MSSVLYSLLKRPVDEEDDYDQKDYQNEDGEFGLARAEGKIGKVVIENGCVRQSLTAL